MKVFILEDDPTRITLLIEWLQGHYLTIVDSCSKVDMFQPPYDLILLDHDLGGRQMTEHEDNGAAFAKLINDKINKNAIVIIHSHNPYGVKRMRDILDGGIIAPFGGGFFRNLLNMAAKACLGL